LTGAIRSAAAPLSKLPDEQETGDHHNCQEREGVDHPEKFTVFKDMTASCAATLRRSALPRNCARPAAIAFHRTTPSRSPAVPAHRSPLRPMSLFRRDAGRA